MDFRSWCALGPLRAVGKHHAGVVEAVDESTGITNLALRLPGAYAESESLARVADRFGKKGVAKFLRNKFPTTTSARSGDVGEVLATAYLHEECGHVVGPSRLIQRDHQEWAMRGDDVLGATVEADGKLNIAKVEAKSRRALGEHTVKAARKGLARRSELPSPHSLTQFAERLLSTDDSDIGEAVLAMQLSDGVHPERVRHLMFLFTCSDPTPHVTADLEGYAGTVPQRTITLRVNGHQTFIKEAYKSVAADGA